MLEKREITSYIIFGVLTTLVNIFTYSFLVLFVDLNYLISNIIAWVISVIFAYITNRKWVFKSKNENIIKEFSLFISGRLFVGVLDMTILFVCVEFLLLNNLISKVITQVIVVISNYLISKLVIFK